MTDTLVATPDPEGQYAYDLTVSFMGPKHGDVVYAVAYVERHARRIAHTLGLNVITYEQVDQ